MQECFFFLFFLSLEIKKKNEKKIDNVYRIYCLVHYFGIKYLPE